MALHRRLSPEVDSQLEESDRPGEQQAPAGLERASAATTLAAAHRDLAEELLDPAEKLDTAEAVVVTASMSLS